MDLHASQFLKYSKDIFLRGEQNNFIDASDRWRETFNWEKEEFKSKSCIDFIYHEDKLLFESALEKISKKSEVHNLECRVLTKSGSHYWMKWDMIPTDYGFIAILENIHKQKESETFLSLLMEESSVGLNLCSLDGKWISSNPAFLKMIGYSKEEADGGKLTYWELTPKKYESEEKLQLDQLQKEKKYGPYEKEFIRKDGTLIPVRLNGFIVYKNGESFIWSIIEDISREKMLKSAMEEKTQLLQAIIDNIPSAVFMKDINNEFRLTLWNKSSEELFQIEREKVLGRTTAEMWSHIDTTPFDFDDRKAAKEGKLVDVQEEVVHRPDGTDIVLHTKKLPLRISKNQYQILAISEDITERKRLELELLESIKLRDEFISIASHELKTPLTALYLQLQMLERSIPEEYRNEKCTEYTSKAIESCRVLKSLIEELLDITQIRVNKLNLHPQQMELNQTIVHIIAHLSEDLKLSKSKLNFNSLNHINSHWDKNRIKQIITNLISNAIKYGEGKPIEVSTEVKDGKAIIKVKDHGEGIDKKYHETIFNCFQRVVSREKVSGLGLGLYIVRQLVEAHNGTVKVESEPGKGALFIVELPIVT